MKMTEKNLKNLCSLMGWEKAKGETYEDVFLRQEIKPELIPPTKLIEVVLSRSLENWATKGRFQSLKKLQAEIEDILIMAVQDPINKDRVRQDLFLQIHNFCIYATNLDKRGRLVAEAENIAEAAWYGELATLMLKEKTDEIFKKPPNPKKYHEVSEKIKKIWGFSDYEIEAFRYFICQTRHENHNPSLNKSLYLHSQKKKTGKTTIARALASVLNGEQTLIDGTKYESSFNQELQIGNHDLPKASQYNCVILDEAMPKDSRKSYGRVKSMLTSNSCVYNQKYGKIMTVKAERHYLYTSNDDISEFVQDDSERRFIQIKMMQIPQQLSFEKIYSIWLEFAQNCEPEKDWQSWYDSFADVYGIESKDVNFFKDEILSNSSVLNSITANPGYTVTLKFFADLLITGKSTRDERKMLQTALIQIIGEPNGYRWNRADAENRLKAAIEIQKNDDFASKMIPELVEDKMPF